MRVNWREYPTQGIHDEVMQRAGRSRSIAAKLTRYLRGLAEEELAAVQAAAELAIKEMGVTFTVYDEEGGYVGPRGNRR
jgi:uncharacterized circularly permuted ATP-grasp superfamily protein